MDEAFLADVAAARADRERLHLWWLSQSGFLVQWQGRHLLLDPYLSDSLTHKYAATGQPHTRMTERVIAPERLDFIDAVTSSHNHTDHLDAETLRPLRRVNPQIELIVPEANRAFVAERLQVPPAVPRGLDAGEFLQSGVFTIHAVPAAHHTLEQDERGRHKFLGYVVGCGPWKIYHSGDTLRYDGMVEWLRPHAIDVALLPINGDRPERKVAGNFERARGGDAGEGDRRGTGHSLPLRPVRVQHGVTGGIGRDGAKTGAAVPGVARRGTLERRGPGRSAGERDEVALQARGLLRQRVVEINLVEVGAHAEEHPARTDRREVAFGQAVLGVEQIFDAVGLGQQLPWLKGSMKISTVEV